MNYLYIIDNKCYYMPKTKELHIIKYTSNTIQHGKVINDKVFFKETYDYLHKRGLINIFFNQKIMCILNPLISKVDQEVMKDILEKMNFNNIKFIYTLDILNLKNNNFIEMNEDYTILYYLNQYNEKKYKYIPNDFFLSVKELNNYIKNIFAHSELDVYVYGTNVNKNTLTSIGKGQKKSTYMLENPDIYIFNQCSK